MTRTDKAMLLFRANPDTWLHWSEFASRCGALAWRTRISDCRKLGLTIENKLVHTDDRTESFYRYTRGQDAHV